MNEVNETAPYWRTWLKAAGIRALRTFAQSAVAMIPIGVTIAEVNWQIVLGTAALAAVLSMLTSIAGLPELEDANARADG